MATSNEENSSILILGGQSSKRSYLNSIYLLDSTSHQWKELKITLPVEIRFFGSAFLNNEIYIFGGFIGVTYQRNCYKLKSDGTWKSLAPLNDQRSNISNSSIAYKGDIWAIGGYHSGCEMKSVEKYDILQDKWIYMPEMNQTRFDAAAAVYKDRIFVTGGVNKDYLKSVEMFDPDLEKWILFCDLPIESCAHSMLITNGSILSIFGGNGNGILYNSVWEIDLEDLEKKWKERASLKQTRACFGAGILPINRVILFGGSGSNSTEVFDGNNWIDGPILPQSLSSFAFISIPHSFEESLLERF